MMYDIQQFNCNRCGWTYWARRTGRLDVIDGVDVIDGELVYRYGEAEDPGCPKCSPKPE